ncbi:extracellular solute-binding protein [Phytohabitans suffuscus]
MSALVASAVVFAATACGDDDSPAPSANAADPLAAYSELIDAAKKEGSVVIYHAESDGQINPQIEEFEKLYGIDVQNTRLSSGPLTARYGSERASGKPVADVIIVGSEPFVDDNPNWFVPLDKDAIPNIDSYPAGSVKGGRAELSINANGIAWNTNLVKGDLVPKSYQDVLKIPGKIVVADPRSSPIQMSTFALLIDTYGTGYFDELRAHGIDIAESGPGAQLVAAGANPVFIGAFPNLVLPLKQQGAPIDYLPIQDPASAVSNYLAISTEAAHPNAARLFVAWRLTKQSHEILCKAGGSASPLGDMPGCEPAPPADFKRPDYALFNDKAWQAKNLPLLGLTP